MPLEIGTASASSLVQDFFDSLASLPSRLRLHGIPWTYSTNHDYVFGENSYQYNDNLESLRGTIYKAMHLFWVVMSVFMLLFIYYCVFGFAVGIAGGELDTQDLEKMAKSSKDSLLQGLEELEKKVDQVAGAATGGKNVVQEKIQQVTEKVEEKLNQKEESDRRKSWGGRKQEEAFEEDKTGQQVKQDSEDKANWEVQDDGDGDGTEEVIEDDETENSGGRGGGIKDKVWRRRRSDASKNTNEDAP